MTDKKRSRADKVGTWIGYFLLAPMLVLIYFAYKILVKGGLVYGLIQLGVDPRWAGILGIILGIIVLYGLAYLFKPIWRKIDAWADNDIDKSSGKERIKEDSES